MSPTLLPHALLGLLALAGPTPPSPANAPGEPLPEVGLSLVSVAGPIAAGATFEVAALFEIEEEWHIYWRDPGETGMATTADLSVPAGFEVEGPFFPAPEVVPLAGGLTSYAFHEEVALFYRVTAPADFVDEGPLEFGVEASWLVCKEACFLGDGKAQLSLSPSVGGQASKAEAGALARSRARLPRPLSMLKGASWRWRETRVEEDTGKHLLELDLRIPVQDVTLLPDATAGLTLRSSTRETADGPLLLLFESRTDPAGKVARGVLVLASEDGPLYYSLEVPVGASPAGH